MVQRVAGYRFVRDDEPHARYGGPGAGRTRGFAHRCRARQPERQDDRERRPPGLRRWQEGQRAQTTPWGYDAGKKVKGRKRQVMVNTDGRGLILEPQSADV